MPARFLSLIVARGGAVGARLRLDETPRVVGRGRDCDLVVPDARISRTHLRVSAMGGHAQVTVCEGAKAVLVRGALAREARLEPGEGLVIGDTALVVTLEEDEGVDSGESRAAMQTDVRTLMTGVGADVQGLAAMMELVDALDAVQSDADVEPALTVWARDCLSASATTFTKAEDEPDLPRHGAAGAAVVERALEDGRGTRLSALVETGEPRWLTFTCDVPSSHVTHTLRRLAAVAARVTSATLTRIAAHRRTAEDLQALRSAVEGSARSFLGSSSAAREVARLVPRLSQSDALVLIEGETGVGKTFLARILHEGGPRAKEPLRVINCAAIPATLIESELFGHERGAFTGAATSRPGALESAGRGTLLLDEIGELPLASQAKLLRVLEERTFERLGSNRPLTLAARILVATNRDLAAMADEGTFRRDLYYRVAVVKLHVPPLRERGDDLVLMAERILADFLPTAGRRVSGFSPEALDVIRRHTWPGNVRELRNAIERALVVGESERLHPEDLPDTVRGAVPLQPADELLVRLPASMAVLEERAIRAAMRAAGGNRFQAAVILGISRTTLWRKLHPEGETEGGGE